MNRKQKAIGAEAARAAVLAALIGLAAGCGSTSLGSSAGPPATTPASTAPATGSASANVPGSTSGSASASASAAATGSGSAARFAGIVEPFDPGHPAWTEPAPADCYNQPSTVSIEQCFQTRTENTDAAIDAVQQARYAAAPPSGQAAILAQDSAWLAARGRASSPSTAGGVWMRSTPAPACCKRAPPASTR